VPGEGLEPTSLLRAEDFKSSASANYVQKCLPFKKKCLPPIEYFNEFMQSRKASNSTSGTLRYYSFKIKSFLETVNPDRATPNDIEKFLMRFQNAGNRHAYFRAIRAFYCWREDVYNLDNPVKKIKAPKVPKLIMPTLKLGDIIKLIDQAVTVREKAIISLFTESGMRLSELSNVRISDINWNQHTIRVLGKGRKERNVTFTQVSENYLRQWFEKSNVESGNIWNTTEGGIVWALRHLEKKTGIKCNPHVFRRSFATIMKSKGVDIAIIRQLGGWESLAMVERYTRSFGFMDALKLYKSPLQDLMTL
jgi:site-specific recombinase XerD